MRSSPRALVFAASACIILAGCSDDARESCIPGRVVDCACGRGDQGYQKCLSSGTYGECQCDGAPDEEDEEAPDGGEEETEERSASPAEARDASSGSGDAGRSPDAGSRSDAGNSSIPDAGTRSDPGDSSIPDAGSRGPVDGGNTPANQVFSGTADLIDLFAQGEELWVVDAQNAFHLSAKDGSMLHAFTAARPLLAAAFDGTHLVVADGAKMTTLKAADLTTVAEGNLVEPCASAVLLSAHRFVCGPGNDWDRIFYTYDALSAQLLVSSPKYTYHGIPMKRVPGFDAFVTVSGYSPSDFFLYKLGADGAVAYVNESPYHGDFAANPVFAFDGDMPEHLINSQGLLLKFSPTCSDASQNSFTSQCFVKDGALGTLSGGQQFMALDSDGPLLTALVNASSAYYPSTSTSDAGYFLQTIDVPSRTLTRQRTVQLPQFSAPKLCSLPDKGMAVIGLEKVSTYLPGTAPGQGGYTITRFDL